MSHHRVQSGILVCGCMYTWVSKKKCACVQLLGILLMLLYYHPGKMTWNRINKPLLNNKTYNFNCGFLLYFIVVVVFCCCFCCCACVRARARVCACVCVCVCFASNGGIFLPLKAESSEGRPKQFLKRVTFPESLSLPLKISKCQKRTYSCKFRIIKNTPSIHIKAFLSCVALYLHELEFNVIWLEIYLYKHMNLILWNYGYCIKAWKCIIFWRVRHLCLKLCYTQSALRRLWLDSMDA